ncbi:MAG TPA: immunoglobulin domain-containing protein [Verrucomicrobiales bacterium]|nr:immunoglobulin domain-containing protein [Verrucomicrobiales bacterium]
MNLRSSLVLAFSAIVTGPAMAGVTIEPLASFGGGDGWRSPGEILLEDQPFTNDGTSYLYLGTNHLERGLAYNPVTKKLVLVSRYAPGPSIRLLDAGTGVDAGAMSLGEQIISSGIFTMSYAAAGTDGAVYVSNLTTNASALNNPWKVYRWDSETDTEPEVLVNASISGFTGTPRVGDCLDLIDTPAGPVLVSGGSGVIGYAIANGAVVTAVSSFNPPGPAGGDFRLAAVFGPGGANDVWGRQTGNTTVRRTTYNGSAGAYTGGATLTAIGEAPMDFTTVAGLPLMAVLELNTAGGDTGRPNVRIYDVSAPATPLLAAASTTATGTLAGNSNGAGSIKWGEITGDTATLYAMSTNQGIQAFKVTVTPEITPVSVAASPASRSVYDRGQTTFTVSAAGSSPIAYQWYKDDAPIQNASSSSYTINPVTPLSAGAYKCRVSNPGPDTAESTPAVLTVLPSVNTNALTEVWHLTPGSRSYITTANTERGMDYYPATNRVYLASRSSKTIRVLSGADGAEIGSLLTDTVSNGATGGENGFDINMLGVAEDGVIYVCNLANVSTGAGFKIYQWANDAPDTAPALLYDDNPVSDRIGDTMDVRGSGAATQIACGVRNKNQFVVFTINDTGFLIPNTVTVDGLPNSAFGLGIAFGSGNTVWGKTGGGSLYLVSYDLAAGTGTVLANYGATVVPGTVGPIGVDAASGFLAAVQNDNSDNVHLYRIPVPFPDPAPATLELLDQEFYTTDNANANGTGSVSAGGGKVFALNTNNGLVCYTTLPPVQSTPPVITDVIRNGSNVVFKLKGTIGKTYLIEKSADLSPAAAWTADGTVMQVVAEETVTRPIPPGTQRLYFRAREQ